MKLYKVLLQTRMKSSYYGNPRYRFVLQDKKGVVIEATTKPDYNFVYGLSEHEDYLDAEVRETKSGRVYIYNAKSITKKEADYRLFCESAQEVGD